MARTGVFMPRLLLLTGNRHLQQSTLCDLLLQLDCTPKATRQDAKEKPKDA